VVKSQAIGSCCHNILILHDPQFTLQHRKEREAHEKTRQNQHELEEKFEKLKSTSVLAFDQYGQLSEQLEQESAMRERAETMATQIVHENRILRRATESIKRLDKASPAIQAVSHSRKLLAYVVKSPGHMISGCRYTMFAWSRL